MRMIVSTGANNPLPFGKFTSTSGFCTVIVSPVFTKVVVPPVEGSSLLDRLDLVVGCDSVFFSIATGAEPSALAFEVGEADSAGATLVLAGVATSFDCFSVFSPLTTCAGASSLACEVGEVDSAVVVLVLAGATTSFDCLSVFSSLITFAEFSALACDVGEADSLGVTLVLACVTASFASRPDFLCLSP